MDGTPPTPLPPTRERLTMDATDIGMTLKEPRPTMEPRRKGVYVGAPACFNLELECQILNRAFDGQCYLVGSALERSDWRDVDVRMMMDDDAFAALFPHAGEQWEFDARRLLMTTCISKRLSDATGLHVDFQFQPQTHANARHKGPRNALGLTFTRK